MYAEGILFEYTVHFYLAAKHRNTRVSVLDDVNYADTSDYETFIAKFFLTESRHTPNAYPFWQS